MAQSVVVKKDEKVSSIFDLLGVDCTCDDFTKKFKEEYPKDWIQINKVYQDHERRDTKGKGHPMPEPNKYMENMYKGGKEKYKKLTD
nr:hypothetical protein [uncultured Anaeromusa sp.]